MKKRITRRSFVAATGALALGGAAAQTEEEKNAVGSTQTSSGNEAGAAKPNVLVIHTDQHRIECLGASGNTDIRTPHIDALANDGVRYDNSFCPFPVCTPSRYSLLSGRYVHEHRGWTNHSTLRPGTPTFPSILKDAGYKTKAVGKMHFTPTYLDLGFDEMELSEQNGPGRWDDDYHRYLRDLGLVDYNDLEDQENPWRKSARRIYWETFGALASNLPDKHHSTTWTGDRAVETLEQWSPSGNLLMAGFIKPHHPFDPPPEWAERYNPDDLEILPGYTPECFAHDLEFSRGYFPHEALHPDAVRRATAYYYAAIEHIDHQVGRMIDVLKRKGLYDNTLIIFTSDHGEYMGYHHLLLKGNYMYDPVVKVPLIIKYLRGPKAGTASQALVSNVDVAPTILDQVSCSPADGMHGRNLAQDTEGRDIVFAEAGRGGLLMARTQTRKFMFWQPKNRIFLYDLENDPFETNNVADHPDYRDETATLKKAALDWLGPQPVPETYLDEDAPIIDQPNARTWSDGHRPGMIAYYDEAMKQTPA